MTQRPADQAEMSGETVTLDSGRTAALQSGISGEFNTTYGPHRIQFAYGDGVMVRTIVGDTYVELLTNLSREEALSVVEGLALPK